MNGFRKIRGLENLILCNQILKTLNKSTVTVPNMSNDMTTHLTQLISVTLHTTHLSHFVIPVQF